MPENESAVVIATPMEKPPKSGKSLVATSWPVSTFHVEEGLTVTDQGVELSAADAKKAYDAAEKADVKLVTLKEAE